MKSRLLRFWAAVLLVFGGAMLIYFGVRQRSPREGISDDFVPSGTASITHAEVELTPPGAAGDTENELREFRLTDQEGKDFDSKSLGGKIWVGSIFFADCPSVCRVLNQRISELQRDFADRGVEFVSITCDPTNDTPKRLADYSRLFNADASRWHFLTGDLALIQRVGNEKFGIAVAEEVHSERLIIFDRSGDIVGSYLSTDRDEFLKASLKLKELLDQTTES